MKRAALIAVLALTVCGTSPEPEEFTLHAVPGSALASPSPPFKVERPTLPVYLDRLQITRQDSARGGVHSDEMKRWAEPLDTMFERILAEDLRQRMPGSFIVTEMDDEPHHPRLTLDSDVQKFNEAGGSYELHAQFTIEDRCLKGTPRQLPFEAQASGSATDALERADRPLCRPHRRSLAANAASDGLPSECSIISSKIEGVLKHPLKLAASSGRRPRPDLGGCWRR